MPNFQVTVQGDPVDVEYREITIPLGPVDPSDPVPPMASVKLYYRHSKFGVQHIHFYLDVTTPGAVNIITQMKTAIEAAVIAKFGD